MRLLLRLVLLCGLTVGGLVALSAPAQACSCAAGTPREAVEGSEAIFVAVARERDASDREVTYELDIVTVLKGDVPAVTSLETGTGGGDCGLHLPIGEPSLVFASYDGGYGSSICAGRGADQADVERLLGPDGPPLAATETDSRAPGAGASWTPWIWAAGGVAAGGLALVGWWFAARGRDLP